MNMHTTLRPSPMLIQPEAFALAPYAVCNMLFAVDVPSTLLMSLV